MSDMIIFKGLFTAKLVRQVSTGQPKRGVQNASPH
jgi:hypothetical protein